MEIVNKNSSNRALLHRLKIRQNSWRPRFTSYPLVLWPYFTNEVTYKEKYFVRHTHYECFSICCVKKGCLQVISNGEVYDVRAGESIFIPPGPHTLSAEYGDTVQCVLGIEGYLLRIILENLSLDRCLVIQNFFTEEYRTLFDEIFSLLGKKDIRNASRLSLLAYTVLMYAVRFVPQKDLPEEVVLSQQFIQRNFFQKITLNDLCKESGCSRTRLCTLFKEYTHLSPGDYITGERHKYAKDLLLSSPHLPVKQVASHCGYRNQLYFANDFKKRTGMTPTQFRAKKIKKIHSNG